MGLDWATLINASSILAPFTVALILHSSTSWPFLGQQALSVGHSFLQLLDLLLEDAGLVLCLPLAVFFLSPGSLESS